MNAYEKRVRELEDEGLTTSDAQSAADAETLIRNQIRGAEADDEVRCPHCGETSDVGSLVGLTTDDCPRCGKPVLFPPAKHTPGPWQFGTYSPSNGARLPENCHRIYMPANAMAFITGENQDANACLIAAAPDLLAALKDLRKELHAHVKLDVKKHYSLMAADAAAGTIIRKATGHD